MKCTPIVLLGFKKLILVFLLTRCLIGKIECNGKQNEVMTRLCRCRKENSKTSKGSVQKNPAREILINHDENYEN